MAKVRYELRRWGGEQIGWYTFRTADDRAELVEERNWLLWLGERTGIREHARIVAIQVTSNPSEGATSLLKRIVEARFRRKSDQIAGVSE